MIRSSSGRERLQQRDAHLAGQLHRLADPVVGVDPLGDVQRGGRHLGAQRLDHRVAAGDQLRATGDLAGPVARLRAGAARPAAGRGRRALRRGPRLAVRRVAGALGGLRRRALALELLASLAAGADGLALLRPRVALGAAALAVAGHQGVSSVMWSASVQRGPVGVSSTSTPAAARASRIASAAAQSLRARASARSCRATATSGRRHRAGRSSVPPPRPGRGERVQAEHVEHRAHRRPGAAQRVVRGVALGEQLVALAHDVVQRGERGRHREVVVHRLGELGAQHAVGGRASDSPRTSAARRTKPSIRR